MFVDAAIIKPVTSLSQAIQCVNYNMTLQEEQQVVG